MLQRPRAKHGGVVEEKALLHLGNEAEDGFTASHLKPRLVSS